MRSLLRHLLCSLVLLLMAGCGIRAPIIAADRPPFDPICFFDGKVVGRGEIYGPLGCRLDSVEIRLVGQALGDEVRVEESLNYGTGGRSRSSYVMRRLGGGRYAVECDDFRGAGIGVPNGTGVFWRYVFVPKVGFGAGMRFEVGDSMQLLDANTMQNEVELHKFGLPVGRLEQTMRRLPDGSR